MIRRRDLLLGAASALVASRAEATRLVTPDGPRVLWCVTDSLFRGYVGGGADWPYLLAAMAGQRADAARGWTGSDRALRFVGSSYTSISPYGTALRSDVVAGSTLATANVEFATLVAGLQRTPTDVILCRGLNDLGNVDSAETVLTATTTWWTAVAAQFPGAAKWQVVPWARATASQARIDYIAGLVAGRAGATVSLIDWRSTPDPGCFTDDPSGVHQDLPASPTTEGTYLGPQSMQSNISWHAQVTLRALYGTHVGGGLAVPRVLTLLSGESL